MIRGIVLVVVAALCVGGCASLDRILRRDDAAQVSETIQRIARVVEAGHTIARSRGLVTPEQSAYIEAGIARARAMGSQGNVQIAKFMLLQIFGELPVGIQEEAEDEHGVSVLDVVAGGR